MSEWKLNKKQLATLKALLTKRKHQLHIEVREGRFEKVHTVEHSSKLYQIDAIKTIMERL